MWTFDREKVSERDRERERERENVRVYLMCAVDLCVCARTLYHPHLHTSRSSWGTIIAMNVPCFVYTQYRCHLCFVSLHGFSLYVGTFASPSIIQIV